MFCPKCGNEVGEKDVFCVKCGHTLREEIKVERPGKEVLIKRKEPTSYKKVIIPLLIIVVIIAGYEILIKSTPTPSTYQPPATQEPANPYEEITALSLLPVGGSDFGWLSRDEIPYSELSQFSAELNVEVVEGALGEYTYSACEGRGYGEFTVGILKLRSESDVISVAEKFKNEITKAGHSSETKTLRDGTTAVFVLSEDEDLVVLSKGPFHVYIEGHPCPKKFHEDTNAIVDAVVDKFQAATSTYTSSSTGQFAPSQEKQAKSEYGEPGVLKVVGEKTEWELPASAQKQNVNTVLNTYPSLSTLESYFIRLYIVNAGESDITHADPPRIELYKKEGTYYQLISTQYVSWRALNCSERIQPSSHCFIEVEFQSHPDIISAPFNSFKIVVKITRNDDQMFYVNIVNPQKAKPKFEIIAVGANEAKNTLVEIKNTGEITIEDYDIHVSSDGSSESWNIKDKPILPDNTRIVEIPSKYPITGRTTRIEMDAPSEFYGPTNEEFLLDLPSTFSNSYPILLASSYSDYDTAHITPDNPLVNQIAQQFKNEKDDYTKVKKTWNWMMDNVKFMAWDYITNPRGVIAKFGYNHPYPEETIRTKEGQCYERSTLVVSLARAAGVDPGKIRAVHGDKGDMGHVWVEFYHNGNWMKIETNSDVSKLISMFPFILQSELFDYAFEKGYYHNIPTYGLDKYQEAGWFNDKYFHLKS